MKLYKYKSLTNLWHVVDILFNHRIYCAHWTELNDPLEGRYEIYLGENSESLESIMASRIEKARDGYRIASLTADPTNFLMWSHYADGHKGIVIELEIPEDVEQLTSVSYSPFASVFTDKLQTKEDLRHLFNGKGIEWEYEQEYRLITDTKYFRLPTRVKRVLLGPLINPEQESTLRQVLPADIEVIKMKLDKVLGTLTLNSVDNTLQATATPPRFSKQ